MNTVVRTDHTVQQYLELGNQSQACITIPETCGSQGGTISVWIKPLGCQDGGGIISSQPQSQSAVVIACRQTELRYMTNSKCYLKLLFHSRTIKTQLILIMYPPRNGKQKLLTKTCHWKIAHNSHTWILFRYALDQTNGPYVIATTKPAGWVHAVMVYHGVEQGITAYHDGGQVGNDMTRTPATRITGNGEVVIGRRVGRV